MNEENKAPENEAPAAEAVPEAKEEKPAPKKDDSAKKSEVKLSAASQKILEGVEKLSVLELADLVSAMEEKFGVSAATPVAVAAAPTAGGDAGGAAEKSEYDIELADAGSQKIAVIKVVREITGLGLGEAKALVDGAPKVVKEKVKKDEAEDIKKKLEEAGAKVELK